MFYFVLIVIIVLYLVNLLIPAKLGRYVYNLAMWSETKLYGFAKQTVAITDMDMCFLHNNKVDKETIIMLHGFSSDKNVWLRFARHFSRNYQVIIPDLAGHGETAFSASWRYDAISQVERVNQLLERLNIDKVHIIGSSMGGLISAHFTHIYPHKVMSVALVDPAGVYSPKQSQKDMMVNEGNNPFLIRSRIAFNTFYAMTMAKPPWLPDCVLASLSEKYQQNIEQLAQIHQDFHHQNMLDNILPSIQNPCLILWGDKDEIIDVSSIDVWQKGLPKARSKVWQGIGHLPILEIPRESAKEYQKFLHDVKNKTL